MQTINDKWKYRLQQLFEMLSLSLDTSLESLSPLVNSPVNDGQFEVSRDLNHTVGTQPSIKLFKRNQSALKCRCIL